MPLYTNLTSDHDPVKVDFATLCFSHKELKSIGKWILKMAKEMKKDELFCETEKQLKDGSTLVLHCEGRTE